MPVSQLPDTFPVLRGEGPRVDASTLVENGTGVLVVLAFLVAIPLLVILTLVTYTVFLIVVVIGLIYDLVMSARIMAQLRGSAIEVGPTQFPAIHACTAAMSERLGIKKPEVFIVQAGQLNAFAARIGKRSVVLLYDDIVSGSLRTGNPDALTFIIAHELAHHALGHTHRFRGYLRSVLKLLSRKDELSADNVALALVDDRQAAAHALVLLTMGPSLMPYLDRQALMRQATAVAADKLSKKAEKKLSHPLLLRRLARAVAAR